MRKLNFVSFLKIIEMDHSENLKNISKAILGFSESNERFFFEAYVLNLLKEEKDCEFFIKIWNHATDFRNWNYKDISMGYTKTMFILEKNYSFEENVAIIITNQAAYQWK